MTGLASMLERNLGDREGALAMFQAAFDTGHPEVAPQAMFWIGLLLQRQVGAGGQRVWVLGSVHAFHDRQQRGEHAPCGGRITGF